MTFLYEYLMFLGQVVTLVIGFIVVASFLVSLGSRGQSAGQGHLQVQKLNEQIRDLRFSMESHLLTADQAKKQHNMFFWHRHIKLFFFLIKYFIRPFDIRISFW